MAKIQRLKDISGQVLYPKTVADAVMYDEQNTMSALAANSLYMGEDEGSIDEINAIDADTLDGHDSTYFASKGDLNDRIDDVNTSVRELLDIKTGPAGKTAYEYAKDSGYLGTEEEFAEKLATDYIDWFGVGISIPEGADLNTYKTNGKYYCTSESRAQTLLNRPEKMNTNFVMWVFSRTSSAIKSQLMLTLTGKMYIRSSSSSAWRNWVAYTTSDEAESMITSILDEAKLSGLFDGPAGKSAYQYAKEGGYTGTEEAFADDINPDTMRAELNTYIAEDLAKRGQLKPEFANDISECTDTNKLYVIPDGYVYGYIKTTETVKHYTDLANNFEIGRINSSGGVSTDSAEGAVTCTDYIGFNVGDVIRIKGFGALTDYKAAWYNGSKVVVDSTELSVNGASTYDYSYDAETGIVTLNIKHQSNNIFIRFSGIPSGTIDDIVITVNEEIIEETVVRYEWANTGHAFIPANYDHMVAVQQTPNFANDISECVDTNKLYVLPDGYIYAYKKITETGRLYTNLAKQEGWEWAENQRTNSSGGLTEQEGVLATDFIPCKLGDIIRVKGLDIIHNDHGYSTVHILTEDKTLTEHGTFSANTAVAHGSMVVNGDIVQHTAGIYPIDAETAYDMSQTAFMRYCGLLMDGYTIDDVVITVNEEIKEGPVTNYRWENTGHAFISSNYDGRIAKLEDENKRQSERITILESGAIGGNGAVGVPSFWENAVNECITKIKALQVGRNCVTFPFFSDNHTRNGYAGVLIAKIMKECHIPYAFYGGDSISSGWIASEAEMIAQDRAFDSAMSYIPNGRFCRAVGNHDGYWAVSADEKHYYTDSQIYELFLREESVAQTKHFGGEGTYYYVDDIASKVRWVVLDTNDSIVEQTQIDWLRDTALSFNESGWAVVFISHQPISNHYHALISNFDTVIAAIEDCTGDSQSNEAEVVGWFSGHIHRDRIYTGVAINTSDDSEGESMPFKQVTITSDHTSIAYDDATKHAIADDDKSHAIDFVTINKETREVNLTRLGIGNDRSYTY